MKLLLDQGLPRSTVRYLNGFGIPAEHVGDLGMASARDAEILETAIQRGAIVISLDSDFHALLATSRATKPSVIRVRIECLKGDQLAKLLVQVVETAREELEAGAVVSVREKRIRVRSLPILG